MDKCQICGKRVGGPRQVVDHYVVRHGVKLKEPIGKGAFDKWYQRIQTEGVKVVEESDNAPE